MIEQLSGEVVNGRLNLNLILPLNERPLADQKNRLNIRKVKGYKTSNK